MEAVVNVFKERLVKMDTADLEANQEIQRLEQCIRKSLMKEVQYRRLEL
jgi:hypothetical protein